MTLTLHWPADPTQLPHTTGPQPICTCGHLHQAHTTRGCQIQWTCPCTTYTPEGTT